jgi:transposase InsO family protein
MARKSDALLKCIEQYENYTGTKVNIVQSDNGGEFTSNYFRQQLQCKGIRLQTTIPYTPEQNGVAERVNSTLVDRARTILIHAGLKTEYWQFVMRAAMHLTNRLPTNAMIADHHSRSGQDPSPMFDIFVSSAAEPTATFQIKSGISLIPRLTCVPF